MKQKKNSLNLKTNDIIRLLVVMFLIMMFLSLFAITKMGLFGDSQPFAFFYILFFSVFLLWLVYLYLKLVD